MIEATPHLLSERIRIVAEDPAGSRGIRFVDGQAEERLTWKQLFEMAGRAAGLLMEYGVQEGTTVAVLADSPRLAVLVIEATWLAGGAILVLPPPVRLQTASAFLTQSMSRIRAADATALVVEGAYGGVTEFAPCPVISASELYEVRTAIAPLTGPPPNAPATVQLTSGSTGAPKYAVTTQASVSANTQAIVAAAEIDPKQDVFVSWLPLAHDMGLIGMLCTCMTYGIELVLSSPSVFASAPLRWMEWMSVHRGTFTAAPNFAYGLTSRYLRNAEPIDLSHVRMFLNGSELVDPETVEAFLSAGAAHGVDPGSPFCAYGLAEATLAVTFPRPGSGMATDEVAPGSPEGQLHGRRGRLRFAKLGRPVPGMDVRIEPDGSGGEGSLGEILVRGSSMFAGYLDDPAPFPADRWFETGDLGYFSGEELVVCGRRREVIIVGGRNLPPTEVERAAAIPGIRRGNVLAFGVASHRGTERVTVVAEVAGGHAAGLERRVREAVQSELGVAPVVVLIEAGTLPKTTSGKLQRLRCRELFLADELHQI